MIINLVLTFLLYVLLIAPAIADIPKHNPVPGGLAVVSLNNQSLEKPVANFGNDELLVVQNDGEWYALIGLACDMLPGNYIIQVQDSLLEAVIREFAVFPLPPSTEKYKSVDSGIGAQIYTTPNQFENIRLSNEAFNKSIITTAEPSEPQLPEFNFSQIVEHSYIVPYGKIIHNGQLITHDFVSMLGALDLSVHSPGSGIVVDIASSQDDGFSVQIDHGHGLKSVIGHLKSVTVNKNQKVKRSQLIGISERIKGIKGSKVDWGISLNNSLINPLQFSSAT